MAAARSGALFAAQPGLLKSGWCIPNERPQRMCVQVSALVELSDAGAASIQQQLPWQIYAGTVAGVVPFVIAGVEFGKRIAQQKRCKVCQGAGLVKRGDYLFRCNGCGGFLPWQSWNRFFSGR